MSHVKIWGNSMSGFNWCMALLNVEFAGIGGPRITCKGIVCAGDRGTLMHAGAPCQDRDGLLLPGRYHNPGWHETLQVKRENPPGDICCVGWSHLCST